MTNQQKPNEYLKVKIQTAQPSELLLLLLDGALRFARQAKPLMGTNEFEEKNRLFLRAQNIVLELFQALDQRIGDELYARLTGLYRFCYDRLVRANVENDTSAVDDALSILEHLRETWGLAVRKARDESGGTPPPPERHALCIEG